MRKIVFLVLLVNQAYGQTFNNTVTIQKDLRVQGETILGGVSKVAGDMFVYYDSIYVPNIIGTGTYLTLDGGYLKLATGGGGVSGLTDKEVLFGKADGTIDQDPRFYFDTDLYVAALGNAMSIGDQSIKWDIGGDYTALYRTSGGSDYNLYLPATQGGANTFLRNDGSGNLTWVSGAGETNTASNLGGGLANFDSKSGVDLRFNSFNSSDFNLSSNLISLDYANGQSASGSNKGFLTSSDWTAFNSKVSFDITGQTSETTLAYNDEIPIQDVSEGAINKITAENALAGFNRPEVVRNYKFTYFNEFINLLGTATGGNDIIATNSGTSAATNNQATDASNRVGLVRSTTGTTATGRTSPSSSSTACAFGGGTWVYEIEVNITTLSDVTNRYQLVFGFLDVQNATNQVDAIAFVYDEGGVSTGSAASANWQTLTSSNSTRTWTTTGTAVSTGWVNLRIEVNAAASSVTYYVNGVAMGTSHTTNIPTGTSRVSGFGYLMIKSIGTTARTMDVDYIFIEQDFTTNR